MTPKLSIVELRGVLQGLNQKLSYRDIQKQNGVAKTTVGRIVERVLNSGLSYDQLLALDDRACLNAIFPPPTKRFIEPDWFEIHKRLGRRKVTLLRLFTTTNKTPIAITAIPTPLSVVAITTGKQRMAFTDHLTGISTMPRASESKLTLSATALNGSNQVGKLLSLGSLLPLYLTAIFSSQRPLRMRASSVGLTALWMRWNTLTVFLRCL